jgi:[acyl-carrier-protein] S-malonyltransferase
MHAVIYPGQGSQHVGMGKFLYQEFSVVREVFEEASDILKINFKNLCFEGPESDLALTENTQPCLLLVSTATYRALASVASLQPKAAAGHSIGEYAALVNSQAIEFSAALKAVRKRGEFMQSAVPVGKGGMMAVMGLTPEQIQQLCVWAKENGPKEGAIAAANFNAPGQIVLSGTQEMIQWVNDNFKAESVFDEPPRRVKFIPLKVSAPFHCQLMQPAEQSMQPILESIEFSTPAYPIYQNVTAQAVSDAKTLRDNLIAQISRPVRWVETIESMNQQGFKNLIECGCGKVLSGLVKKISGSDQNTMTINSLEDFQAVEAFLGQ